MSKIFKIIILLFLGILIISPVRNLITTGINFIYKSISNGVLLPKCQENQILTTDLSNEERILESLTLEQKIGQLFIIGFEGKDLTPQLENLIKEIHPGGILLLERNIEDEDQLKSLIENLQKISLANTGLPLFVAVDQEGGPVSRIDWIEKTPQSEIKNENQAYQIGIKRGKELKELGINLNLAPILDITDSGDFLHNRSFQKNPEEIGKLAKALISGQKESGIFTAIKHFPGYGGISFNPERIKLPILSEIPEISQFETALEVKPEMVMTSNAIYSEVDENFPLTLSSLGIQFLKSELNPVKDCISNGVKNNFLIISDDLSSPALKKEFSLRNTSILAFQAGVDVLIVAGFDEPKDPKSAFNFFLEGVKNGEISEGRINQSVLKIIKLKENLIK